MSKISKTTYQKKITEPPKNAKRFIILSEDGQDDYEITASELARMTGVSHAAAFRRLERYSKNHTSKEKIFTEAVDYFSGVLIHEGATWTADMLRDEVEGLSFNSACKRIHRFNRSKIKIEDVFKSTYQPVPNMRFFRSVVVSDSVVLTEVVS